MLINLPFAAAIGCLLIAVHLQLGGGGRQARPNRLLGAFFFLFAGQLLILSLQLSQPGMQLGVYRVALILTANPLMFWFFRALRGHPDASFRPSDPLHAIPALLVPASIVTGHGNALDVLLFCSMLGYGIGYLFALRKGPRQFQVAPDRAFRWLQAVALFYPLSALLDAAIALELWHDGNLQGSLMLSVAILAVFSISLVLVWGAMGHRPLFDWLLELSTARSAPAIPDAELEQLVERVRAMITRKSVYGDENISMARFSKRVGVPARQVSQAINRGMKMSFSDLLNAVRVDAAQDLLTDDEWRERTVIDIAFEVGFQSKSNFHRAFKQRTGVTPGQYRRHPGAAARPELWREYPERILTAGD